MEKPVWGAPERNKDPILSVLKTHAMQCTNALEVGSGTGQHAVHFATHLPKLVWQCTDQEAYLEGITQWVDEAALANLTEPVVFDINEGIPTELQNKEYDLVYSANTLHIMSWHTVQRFFSLLPKLLAKNALVVLYGPFNYSGKFTSESNQAFHQSLQDQDASMGIRNIEDILQLANQANLVLVEDIAMPANNRCLVFKTA